MGSGMAYPSVGFVRGFGNRNSAVPSGSSLPGTSSHVYALRLDDSRGNFQHADLYCYYSVAPLFRMDVDLRRDGAKKCVSKGRIR